MRVQGRVLAADAIELRDLGHDVVGRREIPWSNLVFLGVEIFLAPRQGCGFAQFKPRIHAPQTRAHGCQRGTDEEPGAP